MQMQTVQSNLDDSQDLFKTMRSPGVNVETLEGRSLFSGGLTGAWVPSGVVLDSNHAPAQVYDMPLNLNTAKTVAAPLAATAAVAKTSAIDGSSARVQLRASDDDGVITGVYLEARPLQAVAPATTAVSFRGNEALVRLDTQSFAGRPPGAWKAANPSTTRRRVLLIEDDPTSRIALATLLSRRGWVVTSAGTVKEGLSQLSEHPDNVIVDLMLPDGQGEDVVQEIRKSHLDAKVTVMTGVSDPARLARLNELHPESILNKPINLAALLRAISKPN